MYTKEEASKIKETFWKTFGQYMALEPSAEGLRINWVNYKTGIKHLHFKMQADNKQAEIGIALSHPDDGIRALMYEQLLQLKPLLHNTLGEQWNWFSATEDDNGNLISGLFCNLDAVNIYKKEDWPKLISFFKTRIIALDAFWTDAQHAFEMFT